tara:strand:+ start:13480 stop:13656 length:177 start_codon:yes stop_codon:yes gene_type:complete
MKKLIMTQKGLSSSVVELSTKELKYIIGLIETDLEYPYDTETFLVFNLLYKKLLKLNK